MKHKRKFYRKYVDNKIHRSRIIFNILIIFMSGMVLYDSYVHVLPFYYILFVIAGILTGRIYLLTNKVLIDESKETISEKAGIVSVLFTILMLFSRFYAGEWSLQKLHVIWFGDALYLFFIGFYYSKIKNTIRRIDEMVYKMMAKDPKS